jgi:hypothetical protein
MFCHNTSVDILSISHKCLQFSARRRSRYSDKPNIIIIVVVIFKSKSPPNVTTLIHRRMIPHMPIPQHRDPHFARKVELKSLYKPCVDELLTDMSVPLGDNIGPHVWTLDNLNKSGIIHVLPDSPTAALNESIDMSHTPLVLVNCPHTTPMNTPLVWRKVWARTHGFVPRAVLESGRRKSRTRDTPDSRGYTHGFGDIFK